MSSAGPGTGSAPSAPPGTAQRGRSLRRNSPRRPRVPGAGVDFVLAAAAEGVNVGWLE